MKRILLLAAVLLTGCGKDPIQPAKPEASLTGTYELLTGEPLSSLTLTGTATHEGQAVAGAFAWKDGATTYDAAGQYDAPGSSLPPTPDNTSRPKGRSR